MNLLASKMKTIQSFTYVFTSHPEAPKKKKKRGQNSAFCGYDICLTDKNYMYTYKFNLTFKLTTTMGKGLYSFMPKQNKGCTPVRTFNGGLCFHSEGLCEHPAGPRLLPSTLLSVKKRSAPRYQNMF